MSTNQVSHEGETLGFVGVLQKDSKKKSAGEFIGELYAVHKVFTFEYIFHTEIHDTLQSREQNKSGHYQSCIVNPRL